MKSELKYYSSVLIILLLVKISAFHIYEDHNSFEDSNPHCELCLLAIEGLQMEGICPSPADLPDPNSIPALHPEETLEPNSTVTAVICSQLFSRPPPASWA